MEIRELLNQYEYPGDDAPIIFGSALSALNGTEPEVGQAKVEELLRIMDEVIQPPIRDITKPFRMSIEGKHSIGGRGIVVTGTIDTGKCKNGEEIELVGYRADPIRSQITGIETFRKQLDNGQAGDNVGLLLKGVTLKQVQRGMIIAKPGQLKPNRKCKAQIYILTEEEGGRKKPFPNGYQPIIYLRTADVSCAINFANEGQLGVGGDNTEVSLTLNFPMYIEVGQKFAIREGGKTIAAGVISEVIQEEEEK